jgi:hypothetical protein
MKGGPAYNVYRDGSGSVPDDYTPSGPANLDGLDSPQSYISPLNGGGNVPTISHWFICYTGGDTPPPPDPEPGNLVVKKAITGAETVQGAVAATFVVTVDCDDLTHEVINVPADGTEVKVEGIAAGSFCTVLETTPTLPAGFTGTVLVTYDPPTAEDNGTNDGVEIPEGADSDPVTITNNYAGVQVSTGGASQPAQAVAVQPAFTG